jgi:methyl-accepting chemotaxis protein
MNSRRRQVDRLLAAALEVAPEQRRAFLDGACRGDDELRGEVESLLAAGDRADAMLAVPAVDVAARLAAESGDALGAVERELERSLAAMAELSRSVAVLSERSAGTEEVIDAVEDVHQNVKVLAVNAALEAARAGEAGRGINVVATEMRALIAGTEASVRQGRALLGAVRGEAADTVGRAERARADLKEHVASLRRSRALISGIIASFGETAAAIDTIASAGEDQKRRIEHVARAMSEMQRSANGLSRAASELLEGAERVARAQAEIGALFEEPGKRSA